MNIKKKKEENQETFLFSENTNYLHESSLIKGLVTYKH